MNARTRMSTFLAQFLAPTALVGCVPPFVPPELDDVACLDVELGAECPDAEAAEAELVGDTTCESPVREVIASGEFVSTEDFVCTARRGAISCEPLTGTTTDVENAYTSCCYEAAYRVHPNESCVVGRPLVVDGVMVSADAVRRADWRHAPSPDLTGLDPAAREALAAAWERAALLEHASIPAFARQALDLVRWGAPPELLTRTAEALQDEVRHAEACFALASAYAGRPIGPSGLQVGAAGAESLAQLAAETFREGCVGESLAVGQAAAQLRGATDPAVRATLAAIVDDERRHAELAWDVVRWAIEAGGEPVRAAVAAEVAALSAPAPGSAEGAEGHGAAAPELVSVALARVLDEVIRPTAAELLAA